jgi:hypothetical protein
MHVPQRDGSRKDTPHNAVERLEGSKTFDPKTEPTDNVSRIFQVPAEQGFAARENPADENRTSH